MWCSLDMIRLPRGHTAVAQPLDVLLRCVERMPATGRLFTSQSPLGPIFLAGLVSVRPEDRSIIHNWFRMVTSRGSKSVSLVLHEHLQFCNSYACTRVYLHCGLS